ncbi:5-formyltetrahydrofolate cyclo-ligase [Sphingomonas cavernae]|uniref:5-formyltetrahydrofolate cyclo-ligase n=1 Tax=Sphingomonas cavernae TaxID=2320861 RepID=A0A418W7Z8_9SPHN|nr:5-formyltetrahydrofolate cyclo-ligase [Sphingomonas cavernae]RJF86124.1 5-formyltetrahydrofolate cyclo-ligase [Sphingomonas cavernae]
MPKALLRQRLKERRDGFAATRRGAPHFTDLPDTLRDWIERASCVSAYVPIGSEADPLPLLLHAREMGHMTALPHVTRPDAPMRFLLWRPGDPLHPGPMGLLQPDAGAPGAAPDLIITPLLGFDRRCHRLGYGAGFYDRAFAGLPTARRVGLAWSVQEVDAVPADSWDVPLHAIWTEREWIEPDRLRRKRFALPPKA